MEKIHVVMAVEAGMHVLVKRQGTRAPVSADGEGDVGLLSVSINKVILLRRSTKLLWKCIGV